MQTGRELVEDIDSYDGGPNGLAFWWLGQHGFVVRMGAATVYLDPFLAASPKRRVPPMLEPADLANADVVLGSHDHGDHIDRKSLPGIAGASPGAKIVVPDLLRDRLCEELGIPAERVVGLDDMTSAEVAGLRITGIAAAHEFLDSDPRTGRYPYLGYVVEGAGRAIYHAGDCCLYEGLVSRLGRWRFDVVFLPINGRDAARLSRGCIGNMTYQEAADLAGALAAGLVVPAHYEMFEGNREDVGLFLDYMKVKYPKLRAVAPRHGQRVDV